LILGATAALQKTAGQVVEDAYNGLKALLINRFQATKAAVNALEENPDDPDARHFVEAKVKSSQVAGDAEIARLAETLIAAVQSHAPQLGRQANVDLTKLTVHGNATLRNIGERVKGREWEIGQDLTIENVGMDNDTDPNA